MQFQKKINIAIDGLSGCGKSTLSRALADRLNYVYFDTGAMYRAMTWYFLNKGISPDQLDSITQLLTEIHINYIQDNGQNKIVLNGKILDDELRSNEVSNNVSNYSIIPILRQKLVEIQQSLSKSGGVVMDGRDIGTVVMPTAELKIFVTCNDDIRAKRRYEELLSKGMHSNYSEVKDNLIIRDRIDSSRAVAPLRKAEDALLLDNSSMTRDEQLEFILEKCYEILS